MTGAAMSTAAGGGTIPCRWSQTARGDEELIHTRHESRNFGLAESARIDTGRPSYSHLAQRSSSSHDAVPTGVTNVCGQYI